MHWDLDFYQRRPVKSAFHVAETRSPILYSLMIGRTDFHEKVIKKERETPQDFIQICHSISM